MVHVTNLGELFLKTIDSNPQDNRDASVILNAVNEGDGQAFTSPLAIIPLTDAVFYLQRNVAFVAPGVLVARLYQALAGTVVGVNAVPDLVTGVLATSAVVPAANIALTWRKTVFNFPAPFTLQPEHDYVIVVVATNMPAGGQVEVGISSTSTHPGNECSSLVPPAWVANAARDCCFYLFSYSTLLAGGVVDVSDRAARLLGIVYGNLAQLQQVPVTLELITQDTGVNTNPERWLHDNHWDSGVELILNAAAAVNLGAAVGAGVTRRIRSITVRNVAQANTIITLSQVAPAQNRVSFDVPAQSTRTWSEQDGVEFLTGVQVQIASSAGAVGSEAYIHAAGDEA